MGIDPLPTRRQALATGLAVMACRRALGQPAERAVYVGIETSAATGQSRACFFGSDGAVTARTPLDFRAHGMAQYGQTLVVFPRRPGNRMALVDLDTLEIRGTATSPPNRHFYGHGAFDRDGRHLLVTENNLDTLGGVVGVYDTAPLRRLGEIALPGAGPHEIVRAREGDRFFIALGGLETHPDYGRIPFNLTSFESAVITLDFHTGDLRRLEPLPSPSGVSLRHVAQDQRGRLYVGGQVADPVRAQGSGVLFVLENDRAVPLPGGDPFAGYVSSVAAHGARALATSKRSNLVLGLDGARAIARHSIPGASAVGLGPTVQAMSGFETLTLGNTRSAASEGFEFDNHGFALANP